VRDAELPWVHVGDGIELKVLRGRDTGVWVVRNRFAPGVRFDAQAHGRRARLHVVGLLALRGVRIDYAAGTYIYELAGSVHTLTVNADNGGPTDVLFVMRART
jgi:hypothetical protein